MTKAQPSSGFKVAISRDSFLSACHLLLRTVRSRKAQSEEVTFYFNKEGFRFAWGEANVGVSAEGSWPQKVTIPGRDFLAIAKFPPAGNPLAFEVRDKRFNCSTWSCACYMEEPPDGLLQPELIPQESAVTAPISSIKDESSKNKPRSGDPAQEQKIRLPTCTTFATIAAVPLKFTPKEIQASGLDSLVATGDKHLQKKIATAFKALRDYHVTEEVLRALVNQSLKNEGIPDEICKTDAPDETAESRRLKDMQRSIEHIRSNLERDFFNELVPEDGPLPEEPTSMRLMTELLAILREEAEATAGLLEDMETNVQNAQTYEDEHAPNVQNQPDLPKKRIGTLTWTNGPEHP